MNPNLKRLDNGIWVMAHDTHLSRWVEQDGRLDHAHSFLERFRHLIPVGGTVIDCGTSIGDHTVTYASMVGPTGTVLGFEANPDVAECCALNLAIYEWAKIYNIGLSDDFSIATMTLLDNVGASYVSKPGAESTIHVKLYPLDDYIDQVDRCDFIKVDVEGYEPRLLKGARRFLAKYSPAILMEVNRLALERQGFTQKDIFRILQEYGYQWVVADGVADSEQYEILATKKK